MLGHENLGEMIEVGVAVAQVKVGDMVCLPFNISCGFCKNCERGFTGFCLTVNPGNAGGAYGYAGMGPFNGGQPSTCACRTGISTACGFPRTRVRRRPIM